MHRAYPSAGIALTALVLIASWVAAAPKDPDPVKWFSDLDKGVARAKELKKPLVIEFTADWCHYCKKMDRETMSDPKVKAEIKGCFVAVRLDADQHASILQELGISGIPATLLVDTQSRRGEQIAGFRGADEFLRSLRDFCAAHKRTANAAPDQPPRR